MAPTDLLNMLVADVLQWAPETAQVFLAQGMSCLGCPFAHFDTVADVAAVYGVDPDELARSLVQAADARALTYED